MQVVDCYTFLKSCTFLECWQYSQRIAFLKLSIRFHYDCFWMVIMWFWLSKLDSIYTFIILQWRSACNLLVILWIYSLLKIANSNLFHWQWLIYPKVKLLNNNKMEYTYEFDLPLLNVDDCSNEQPCCLISKCIEAGQLK